MIKDDNKILGPLISIKNIPQKGLRICWNFQGLMSEIDYQIYHIFFFVGVNFEQSKKLLKLYYQNMKMGELIGIYRQGYDDQGKYKKQVKWTQKTSFQLESEFFREKHIWNQLTQNDIKFLVSQTAKNRGQVIINVITTQIILKDFESFSSIIKNIRQKNKDSEKLIFNFVGKMTSVTRVDCTVGINVFFYDHQNQRKVIKQIKNFLKVIVLKKLRVRILMNNNYHCKLNGDDSWKISQSSILQKDYYAIPSCSFKQYLIFISSDQDPVMEMNLKFIMEFSYYNDKQIVSKREINFVTNSNQIKYQTVFNFENIQFGPTELKKQIYWTNLIKKYCYVIIFKTQSQ